MQRPSYSEEDWQRVGRIVQKRRTRRGYNSAKAFARDAGVGARMVAGLESGEPVGEKTRLRISRGLGFGDDGLDELLADDQLTEADVEEQPGVIVPRYPESLRDDVERKLWDIDDLSEDDRWSQIYVYRARIAEVRDRRRMRQAEDAALHDSTPMEQP